MQLTKHEESKLTGKWTTLRFTHCSMAQILEGRLFRYRAVLLNGHELYFLYSVPNGHQPAKLLDDLSYLAREKWWVDAMLTEGPKKMLMIKGVREIKNQQEMEERSRLESRVIVC